MALPLSRSSPLLKSRCVLWQGTLRRDATDSRRPLHWDVQVLGEDSSLFHDLHQAALPRDKEAHEAACLSTLESGQKRWSQCLRLQVSDGTLCWVQEEAQLEPLGEETWRVTGAWINITDSKRSEKHLNQIFGSAQCLVWHSLVDQRPVIDEETKNLARLQETLDQGYYFHWHSGAILEETLVESWLPLPRQPASPFGLNLYHACTPESRRTVNQVSSAALRAGLGSYSHQFVVQLKEGVSCWLQENVQIICLSPGCWELTGICTNITNQKQEEERLAQLMRSARCLVWQAHVERLPILDHESESIAQVQGTQARGYYYRWDAATVHDEEAAQLWLPIARRANHSYALDLYLARAREDRIAGIRASADALEQGKDSYSIEYPLPLIDKSTRWIQDDVRIVSQGQNHWLMVGVCMDQTERHLSETRRRRFMSAARCLFWQATVYDQVAPHTNELHFHWDLSVIDEDASQRWLPVVQHPGNTFTEDFYLSRAPEVRRANDLCADNALRTRASSYQQEFPIPLMDGSVRWLREDVQITEVSPGVRTLVGVCTDITARRKSEELLLHRTLHDSLTGLPNRLALFTRLEALLADKRNRPVLLFLDLDNFKVINDSIGHLVGDSVLQTVAHRLRDALPPEIDVVRLGGDEFTILIPQEPEKERLLELVQHIKSALQEPLVLEQRTFILSASIGIATNTGRDATELLRHADAAMYKAKHGGRARHAFFDQELETSTQTRLELELALRRALDTEEIRLVFQPILSLKTGQITGFEALARWYHPSKGMISPADFIPIAEETGLILPLGNQILRRACQAAQEWRQQGHALGISVNVSSLQLRDPHFVEQVQGVLRDTGLAPETLTLEITESVMMADSSENQSLLHVFAALGIRLAMDDFGTGYSSMAYLSQMPIHNLKVDRRFIDRLTHQDPKIVRDNKAIVRAIVALAHSLEMQVTAEGIETEEQLLLLKRKGCEFGQGYHLSHPLSPVEVHSLLHAQAPARQRAA